MFINVYVTICICIKLNINSYRISKSNVNHSSLLPLLIYNFLFQQAESEKTGSHQPFT